MSVITPPPFRQSNHPKWGLTLVLLNWPLMVLCCPMFWLSHRIPAGERFRSSSHRTSSNSRLLKHHSSIFQPAQAFTDMNFSSLRSFRRCYQVLGGLKACLVCTAHKFVSPRSCGMPPHVSSLLSRKHQPIRQHRQRCLSIFFFIGFLVSSLNAKEMLLRFDS